MKAMKNIWKRRKDMRVIKFRAWDNGNNGMLDVQNLDFKDCFYGGEIQIRTTMYNDYFDIREMPLMQYTGLHDKNGKEIYEGDIVRLYGEFGDEEYIGIIEYQLASFVITTKTVTDDLGNIDIEEQKLEIIGNIYENKKLLEV